jgi:hypothetical protein
MKRGVLILGVFLVVPPGVRSGDREREGEWYWEGGSETMGGVWATGGVGATEVGHGVVGAEFTASGRGVIGAEPTALASCVASPIFFFLDASSFFSYLAVSNYNLV